MDLVQLSASAIKLGEQLAPQPVLAQTPVQIQAMQPPFTDFQIVLVSCCQHY